MLLRLMRLFENPRGVHRVRVGLVVILAAAALWTAWGHQRYFLSGDPNVTFAQGILLRQGYVATNLHAMAARAHGEEAPPVRLLVEGGFPVVLRALRLLGDRAPFLANVLFAPALLVLLGLYVSRTEPDPERRFLAGLLAPGLVVSFSVTGMTLWHLVLPFRDILSHTLGFAALVLLPTRETEHRKLRLLLAGFACGYSAWTRLTGILFAVPMALHLAAWPGLGTWRRRLAMLAWTAAGGVIGLLPLLGQNLLENRGLLAPPQAENLLLQERTVRVSGARAGWHPLNFGRTWGRLVSEIAGYFPAWFKILVAISLAGRLLIERRVRRLLPAAGGLLAFGLFYACYHRTVTRYYFIIAVFFVALAAPVLAGLAAAPWRRWPRARPAALFLLGVFVAGYAAQAGLRSGSDPRRVRREWKDARMFRAWIRQAVRPPYHVVTSAMGYLLWTRYFAEAPPVPWPGSPLRTGPVRHTRLPFPDDTELYLLSLLDRANEELPSWSRDTLLNRYALESAGPDVRPRSTPAFRFERIRPRGPGRREIEAAGRHRGATHLYVYLRDLTSTNRTEPMTLAADGWPAPAPVELQAGPNLVRLSAAAPVVSLDGATPTPSVVTAAWVPDGAPVHVPFSELESLSSRHLMAPDCRLVWRGYEHWGRDRAGQADKFWAHPFFVFTNGTAIRLPRVAESPPPALVVRLYYTALLANRADEPRLSGMDYGYGAARRAPLLVHVNRPYDGPGDSKAFDFFHEIEIPAGARDLTLNMPEPIPTLLCHGMTFFVEDSEPAAPLPAPPRAIPYQWNEDRARRWYYDLFDFPAWQGRVFRAYAQKLAGRAGPEGLIAADGWIRQITQAYGGPVRSARELLAGGRAAVDARLNAGLAVYVLDLDQPIASTSAAFRLFREFYDMEPTESLGPVARANGGAAARQLVLYRVRPRP